MTVPSRPESALEVGWARLEPSNAKVWAENAGAKLLPGGHGLLLPVIDRRYEVDLQAREIREDGGGRADMDPHLRILILHYIAGAGKAELTDKLATFREFEAGDLYYSVLKTRSIDPVFRAFGATPDALRTRCEALGGEAVKVGNLGFKLRLFPKLPIVVVLWLGDEEVSGSANILFDASAGQMLPTEDLAIAAESLVHRLIEK